MQILAILTAKPSSNLSDFEPLAVAEEKIVWTHYKAGTIRSMNFQPEPLRVLLHFEATDKDNVHAMLKEFPMIQAGLFDIDLIAAGPWLPLAALFSKDV